MFTKSRPVELVLILILCLSIPVINISYKQHEQSLEDLEYNKLN